MSFTLSSGYILADTRIQRVRGRPILGGAQLHFDVEFAMKAREDGAALTSLCGDLSIRGRGAVTHYVGRLRSLNEPAIYESVPHATERQDTLVIDLDLRTLNQIERVRDGDGLSFEMNFRSLAYAGTSFSRVSDQVQYQVNQGVWIEVLKQLGHSNIMLLEVPLPDGKISEPFGSACDHLLQAQNFIQRGDWREAVGRCRDVLESISVALGDNDAQEGQVLFQDTRSMDKAARMRVHRRAMKILSHPARHADEVSAKHNWSRGDAVMLVASCAALLQRLIRGDDSN